MGSYREHACSRTWHGPARIGPVKRAYGGGCADLRLLTGPIKEPVAEGWDLWSAAVVKLRTLIDRPTQPGESQDAPEPEQ